MLINLQAYIISQLFWKWEASLFRNKLLCLVWQIPVWHHMRPVERFQTNTCDMYATEI